MRPTWAIHEMTVAEKLELMEALWMELSPISDSLDSPDWHREVLDERARRIASGEAVFMDWELAKADIRRQVS